MTENLASHITVPTTVPSPAPRGLRGCRDRELLTYVGRHGIVAMPQVMAALGMGQSVAYDRVASCIRAGLLERLELLRGEPSLLRSTRAGLRYAGLGLPVAVVSPGAVDHWLRCATTAHLLAERYGPHRILTERELALAERIEGAPIASAKIGELPTGHPRLHRPDLVVLPEGHPLVRVRERGSAPETAAPAGNRAPRPGEDGEAFNPALDVPTNGSTDHRVWESSGPSVRPHNTRGPSPAAHPRTREQRGEIAGHDERPSAGAEEMRAYGEDMRAYGEADHLPVAVEIELTPKSPRRLEQIIRGWRRAENLQAVHYHCAPGQTRRAVERAVKKLYAQDHVVITEVVPGVGNGQVAGSEKPRHEQSLSGGAR